MLKPLIEDDFDTYVDFACRLALDTKKSGYPTYTDGIKTKQDFISRARKAFSRENEEILLYEQDGQVRGWIHYYVLPEDHYVDTCSFCIEEGMGEAINEFVSFVKEHFPGDELFLGFPKENRNACEALTALGFEIIEESYNDVLPFDTYSLLPENEAVVPITRQNYQLFSSVHDQHTDMYWISERILADIDEWMIFVYLKEGVPAGAVYFMVSEDKDLDEIFGVDFMDDLYDPAMFRDLMAAALNEDKRRGARFMVFFSEEVSQADALSCGFHCVGEYVCFKLAI